MFLLPTPGLALDSALPRAQRLHGKLRKGPEKAQHTREAVLPEGSPSSPHEHGLSVCHLGLHSLARSWCRLGEVRRGQRPPQHVLPGCGYQPGNCRVRGNTRGRWLVGAPRPHQKAAGLIPLREATDRCVSLTLMFLSLSAKSIITSSGEDQGTTRPRVTEDKARRLLKATLSSTERYWGGN